VKYQPERQVHEKQAVLYFKANCPSTVKRRQTHIGPDVTFRTDKHKDYSIVLTGYFPNAIHLTHRGKRSRTNVQREMKKTGRGRFSVLSKPSVCSDIRWADWRISHGIHRREFRG